MTTNTLNESRQMYKFAFALALITLLGPVATDMYLPSMPDIAKHLNTSYANIQLTLTVYLAAQGAGQLFFGPIVDRLGRRRPLMFGIVLFIIASLWTAAAGSVLTLFAARLLQGLSASLTLVVAMSKIRDVSEGVKAAQLFALLMTIEGLAPVLAPTAGGYIDFYFGWRTVMASLALMGIVALVSSIINLKETLPPEKRLPLSPKTVAGHYTRIICDKKFLIPALALSMAFLFLFSYVCGASYVYQNFYGLSSGTFGLIFGLTGISVMFGAAASAKTVERAGINKLAISGALFMLAGAAIALFADLSGIGLPGVVFGMFIAMFGLGIAEAILMSMAMSSQDKALGYTAALLGSLQLIIASAATPFAGFFAERSAAAWLAFLVFAGICVMSFSIFAVHTNRGSKVGALSHH